jgi:hypothetical protein
MAFPQCVRAARYRHSGDPRIEQLPGRLNQHHSQTPTAHQAEIARRDKDPPRAKPTESLAVHWGKPILCGARTIGFICVVETGFGAFDPYGTLISVHRIEDHARRALVANAAERRMR